MNKKISVAITTYNRPNETVNVFKEVINDERIGEVVIVDDDSEQLNFSKLQDNISQYNKIKLFRNSNNIGCYLNKYKSVFLSNFDWVAMIDSDNELTSEYIDAFCSIEEPDANTIYAPDWLMPTFDYRHFSGIVIDKTNVAQYAEMPMFDCLINSCNYVVPREKFIKNFDTSVKKYADDTAYINYIWLKNGGKIKIVEGMRYNHKIHDGSHYQQYAVQSQEGFNELMAAFKNMK